MNTMTFHGHWHAIEGIALASALIFYIGVSLAPTTEYTDTAALSENENISQEQTRRGMRSYSNSIQTEASAVLAVSSEELDRRRMRADASSMEVEDIAEVKGRPGRQY
ncbi:hypothetical protein [Marinobacterium lutimaris]|uniref:Uncharacterized protein n=1 Tax=Marinobacterium lutimaris TaxID=568106 RepID=A0A1H5V6C0_9GAMM|nr:hypothetical protein [Marinobacterium lutimaris]SEF82760.1 hypothetical protein SAMN05444390_101632 [Marinobacterium lutimaris]